MNKVVVIGAGGHARSVMDILFQQQEYEVIGCLDPSYLNRRSVEQMEDIPIIGDDSLIPKLRTMGIKYVFVALGDNQLRMRLIKTVLNHQLKLVNAISPYAIISPRAVLGEGICVMAGAVINVNCEIGNGSIINTNVSIDHDCQIQEYVHIAPGTAVSGSTLIDMGTHVGTNASIIDGIHIGAWSYIGAGAVVVSDIPERVMAYGVPAKIVKSI